VADQFPNLITGAVPDSILCTTTFAPLMDMRYLYAWRLLVDRILGSSDGDDISFFRLFLARASLCLHSDTYLGTELLPELTPNMCLHFRSHGGWPTTGRGTDAVDPLADFSRSEVTSQIAQRYDCITIDVHPDRPAPASNVKLITASEAPAIRHTASTPRESRVPTDNISRALGRAQAPATQEPTDVLIASPPAANRIRPLANPGNPSGTNLFGSAVYSPPDKRLSSKTSSSVAAAGSLAPIANQPKWPELLTWSIATPASRLACAPEFLALSLLLIHGPLLLAGYQQPGLSSASGFPQ
jgi:hypothetical protein